MYPELLYSPSDGGGILLTDQMPALTLAEYRARPREMQTIELPQRGLQIPDIKDIYTKEGWWREISVGIVGRTANRLQEKVANDLMYRFAVQGHTTHVPSSEGKLKAPDNIDMLFAHLDIPKEGGELVNRIPDSKKFAGLEVLKDFGVRKSPGQLVGITTISERLSATPHEDVVYIARRTFFRMGVPCAVFITQNAMGNLDELTLVTPEGGAISIPVNHYDNAIQELRDSLVTLKMAKELPTDDDRSTPFPLEEFEKSRYPKVMIATGGRLDQLGFLKPPIDSHEHTTSWIKLMALKTYVGSQAWAEGAWLAVDPEGTIAPGTGTVYMSATGSDGADKRNMTDMDVVPVGAVVNGKLQVFPVPGKDTRKASVEARELKALVDKAPKIRVKKVNGLYIPDPNGDIVTSMWAAFIHLHVDNTQVDPSIILELPPDIARLPYGVGCGTDLMAEMSNDYATRAQEILLADAGRYLGVSGPVNRHGRIYGIPWHAIVEGRDGQLHQGLEAFIELADPESYGAIVIDPHNVPQFPQGDWPMTIPLAV